MSEEYWKIKDTLNLIKIAKEDKKNGVMEKSTVTKDYINHLSTNVNLMRESAKFERERILELIDKFFESKKNVDFIEIKELKNAILGEEGQ